MINSFENLKKIVSIENMNITKYMKYHKICIYLIDQNNLSSSHYLLLMDEESSIEIYIILNFMTVEYRINILRDIFLFS